MKTNDGDAEYGKEARAWRKYCRDFFTVGDPTEISKYVLDSFVRREFRDSDGEDRKRILQSLGFTFVPVMDGRRGTFRLELGGHRAVAFEKIKNDVRREYHAKASKERAEHMRRVLSKYVSASARDKEVTVDLDQVRDYARTSKPSSAEIPFMLGLRKCLKLQLKQKTRAVEWTFADEALSESGICESGVRLLVETLHFTVGERDQKTGDRRWVVGIHLKDAQIRQILRALPSYSAQFRATGTMRASDVMRAHDTSNNALESERFPSWVSYFCCCCLPVPVRESQ